MIELIANLGKFKTGSNCSLLLKGALSLGRIGINRFIDVNKFCMHLTESVQISSQSLDLGPTTQLLGLEIYRDRANLTLSISQRWFITNLLLDHGLQDCKPVSTPLNPGCRLSTSMCPQTEAEALKMCQYPYISNCWVSDASGPHHKAWHHLCRWSSCQI